jgi:hypothetical protein
LHHVLQGQNVRAEDVLDANTGRVTFLCNHIAMSPCFLLCCLQSHFSLTV